ncbi:hypothetical protein L6R49_25125 [Myxococcota bacterium]|nr:hypothetical protein [Myxococcota bacterium]
MTDNGLAPQLDGDALAAATLFAALGAPTPAVVINDARSGGRSVDPIPLAPTPARIVSHHLSLTENGPRDAWQVVSRLVIENPTASALRLRLALPEERPYEEADASGWAGRFQDLTALVDGEELPISTASVTGVEDERLGDVYVLELRIPAMGRATLQLAYLVDRSSGLDWWGPRHHARAPDLWGAPVGELRLTVTLRRPTLYVIHPRSLLLTRFEERGDPNGDGSLTELVFDARPWRPDHDLVLAFPGPSVEGWCVDGVLPGYDGSLTLSELRPILQSLSDEALAAYADHVRALHGVGPAPVTPTLPDWADPRDFALVPRPASPRFEDSWLSPGEQSSLDAVAAERRRRQRG